MQYFYFTLKFSCTGISTYAFECPSGLKYDQEAAQCDYANNIPDCGGQRPTTPAPVVPSQEAPGNGQPQQAPSGGNPNGQPQPMSSNATHPQQPGIKNVFKLFLFDIL